MSAIVVERYEIQEPIGRGAFGQVFLAQDVLSGQQVALKRFFEQAHDRWREATALRALNLPGVVRLLDEGIYQGAPFIVTELVSQGQRFPGPHTQPQALFELAIRLLEIVENIHAHGLIHGDLKPTNVLIDAQGQPVILDLGLARSSFVGAADQESDRLEGSPRYMAPELFRQEPPSPATDLYAIGVMLFEAAAGKPPHRGESMMELLRERLLEPCPSLRAFAPDSPEELIELVDALLNDEPARRKRSMRQTSQEALGFELDVTELKVKLIDLLQQRQSVQLLGPQGAGRAWLIARALEAKELKHRRAHWLKGEAPLQELIESFDAQHAPDHRTIEALKTSLVEAARQRRDDLIIFERPPEPWLMHWLMAMSEHISVIICHDDELLWPPHALHVTPHSPERLAALFHGPELGFHLASRAAWQLYLRTGGLPSRVIKTIEQWRRHGLCARHEGRERLSLQGVEALERGWHIPNMQPSSQEHKQQHSPQAQTIIDLLSVGQGCLTHDELVALMECPSWVITTQANTLARQGELVIDGPRYVLLRAPLQPELRKDANLLEQAKRMSDRQPITHPCQLMLLELEQDPQVLTQRAQTLAQALDKAGHITKATHILSRSCVRLRYQRHDEGVVTLLSLWAKIALSTHAAPSIEEVLYQCVRSHSERPNDPSLKPLITLLEAARIACRTRNQAALEHIEAIPAFEDVTLELRRQMYRGYLSFAMTDGALERVIREVECWVSAHGDQEARATLIGWRGWLAYSKNDFALATKLHLEAAELKTRSSAKLSSTLAAISSMLDNAELEAALSLAKAARQLAASIHHTSYELQAAHFIHSANYRLADDEVRSFDHELLEASAVASLKDLEAATRLYVGVKYMRQGAHELAKAHLSAAIELWRTVKRAHLEYLALALLNHLEGDPTQAEQLELRLKALKPCQAKQQALIINSCTIRQTPLRFNKLPGRLEVLNEQEMKENQRC